MNRVLFPLLSLALSLSLSAATAQAGVPPSIEIDGVIRGDILVRKPRASGSQSEAAVSESFVRLSSQVSDHIRVAVALELNRALRENGQWTEQEAVRLNELLREATLEIHDIGGVPVAVVLGKQEIAFGQAIAAMPAYTRSPLYNTQSINRVMGLTVRLDERILDIIHSIEASVFSSEQDQAGRIDSASVRVRGEIFEGLQFQASAMHLGNRHLGGGSSEQRYSVGLVYQDPKGNWMAWVEGLYHADKNNPNYGQNAHFALTAGASRNLGPGTVVAEITWIQNVLLEVGVGYRLNLSRNVSIGPEVRYSHSLDPSGSSEDELRAAITVEILLGPNVENPDDQVLFGAKPGERQ
jgi:hypothetical protein